MKDSSYPANPVVLVDDEEQFLLSAEFTLNANGINNTLTLSDSRELLPMLEKKPVSVVLLDMTMPYIKGWELLPQITERFPEVPVIILTAINEVELAVDSMKNGAMDYILKPVDDTRLIATIRKAVEINEIRAENRRLKSYFLSDKLENPEAFDAIITCDPRMRKIFQYVEAVAPSPLPILISGETGVGKELIARAIHFNSNRNGEFVPVNVAGVDDHLFSDTLFGHKKGAFTGADRDRKGMIEQATNGTLFLDEIGDLGFESQVKLLRLLQESKYYPIGSDVPKTANVRIVLATNADLYNLQKEGKFRKDLYYRIQAHHIVLPPLRNRPEDIALLLEHFLEKAAKALNKKKPTPPKELVTLLTNYGFPGNVRELEGMVFDAVSRHRSGILSMEAFKEKVVPQLGEEPMVHQPDVNADSSNGLMMSGDHFPTLKEMENMLIDKALERADGNQTIAAQLLGLSRRALNNRLSRAKK